MSRAVRGNDYLSKAVKHLTWAESALDEQRVAARGGRLDDAERRLFAGLASLGTVAEALLDAANCFGRTGWRDALLAQRDADPLLNFLHHARDEEIHRLAAKWSATGNAIEFIVVEATKTRVFWWFRHWLDPGREWQLMLKYIFGVRTQRQLFDRFRADPTPIPERLAEAGVELRYALTDLFFHDFSFIRKGKVIEVKAPLSHLGQRESTRAEACVDKAIAFYRRKVEELKALGPEQPQEVAGMGDADPVA